MMSDQKTAVAPLQCDGCGRIVLPARAGQPPVKYIRRDDGRVLARCCSRPAENHQPRPSAAEGEEGR